MKRVLTVVLCLALIVSSFATVLFPGASANAGSSVFDNPNNWDLYEFSTSHVNSSQGTAPTRGTITQNLNTAYTYGGDASSISVNAKIQLAVVEFDVEANTDYEFSYKFLAVGAPYNSNGVDTYLVRTGIVTPNGSVKPGQDGYIYYMATNDCYFAPNGVVANKSPLTNRTSDWSAAGVWNQVTLSFNSGDNTKLKLVVQPGTDTFYADDFSLNEKYDFESLSNWGIYNTSSTDTSYQVATNYDGETCQTKMGWCNIKADTSQDADSTGKSIRINGNTFNVAANLPTLKANTKYTLSFKYKPGATTTVAGSNSAYFTSHIIKKGTAFNQWNSGPAEFIADLGKGTATTDWKQISVDFTTDSTTDYMLEFRFGFAAGYECFLDEFSITEKERPTYFIQDFEDYTKTNKEYYGGVSIVEPEGTKISGNKAVLYDGSAATNTAEAQNRVIINPASSNLPTLGEIVNKGDKFKLTLKYKLLEGNVSFYVHSSKDGSDAGNSHNALNPISYKSTALSEGNAWQEFSYEFTLKAEAVEGTYSYPTLLIGGTGKAYFDYITVSTLTADVPDVEIPEETTLDPFENILNWGIYHKDAKGDYLGYATVDGTAPAKRDWASITINEDAAYTSTGGGKSVKIHGNTLLNTVKLNDLKANTTYTLAFKYLISKDSTWGSSSMAWFTPYIVKKGVAMSGANASEYFVTGAKVTTPASPSDGSWKDFTIEFTTDSTTEFFFALYNTFASGFDIYLDEFTVTEKQVTPEPETDPFEDISNWGVYHKDAKGDYPGYATVDGTAPAKRDWVNISIDNTVTAAGEGASVKLNGNTTLNTVKIPDLKANTNYDLTFKYLIPKDATWGSSAKAWFTPGIIKKGIAMNGANPAEYFAKGTAPTTPTSPSDGSWKDYTLSFETDDSTDFFLGITATMAGGYIIYLDEIKVTEKTGGGTEPEPPVTPDPVDPADYDNAANWKLYHADYNAPIINGNGLDSYSWINNSQNTDKTYTYNGGEKSVKFNGNIQYTAIKLANLTEGKAYKVKFMYYAPTTSTVGSSSKAWVNGVGILKGGTTMKANAPTEYFKKGATFAGEAGKWHEYTMNFRAETTDLYFGMGLTFGAGFILYLDDFTVTETTEDPDAPPVVPGKEPKKEVVIDFDTYGGDATLSPADRIEIVDAVGYDGKTSKMLHFKKGVYTNATTLNYASTYATDTDAVFTIGVKPNKVYNLSFRVKTNSQTLPDNATKDEWIGIYACFNKKYLVSSYQHNAKRDEWLYYNYPVNTSADQNLLSFYVIAGEYTPDMWIDDIVITESDYEPFLGWGTEPKDEILINFDDFYVNYDIACASIVDGPERNGKVSKATYLKGGNYDYNVVANYGSVTKYQDSVFTVPCKENTLYEFSYYIYIPKDTGSLAYFAVYYDWANTWVLRASGMTERDQWVKKTTRFTTKKGQTQLSLTFNGGKVIPDIYLDDILLKELKPGVVSYANDSSYCEECFNILPDNGAVEKITAAKTTVIKIPVLVQQQYIFGITVNSSKKSNSRIFLSFDGVNPMQMSDDGAPSAIISSDGKLGRYGINFISGTSGYVYLVIENDDGALTLTDPYLFLANSMSTNLPMGRAEKQVADGLSVNINKGYLKKLFVFDEEDEEGGEPA